MLGQQSHRFSLIFDGKALEYTNVTGMIGMCVLRQNERPQIYFRETNGFRDSI